MSRWSARDGIFGAVLILLLGAGWAANHFASMLGVLRDQEHLSDVLLNGAYGIYALGLLRTFASVSDVSKNEPLMPENTSYPGFFWICTAWVHTSS
ncbi:MAG: hypothetical protein ACTH0M_09525 [Brevibacterium yomogidense]|uniref:hypothetical protein n=1 Tax=Brevibacterium aurantiacum TaxID=273384 RepID=UPI003F8DEE6E